MRIFCNTHPTRVPNGFAVQRDRITDYFIPARDIKEVLQQALPAVIFLIPPIILPQGDKIRRGPCSECSLQHRGQCGEGGSNTDPNQQEILQAVRHSNPSQQCSEAEDNFTSLSEALRSCYISTAIYKSKAVQRGAEQIKRGCPDQSQDKAEDEVSLSPNPDGNQGPLAAIRDSYKELLQSYENTQQHRPGYERAVRGFLINQGSLERVADHIYQLEHRANALQGQLELIREKIALNQRQEEQDQLPGSSEIGAKKRRSSDQLEDTPLVRAVQNVDQGTQYEGPTQSTSAIPPRHYMHHSAMVHIDCRPPFSRLQPIDKQLYEKVIVTLRDNWHFQKNTPSGILRYEDLATLSEENWLNDVVISEYLALICQDSTKKPDAELLGVFHNVSPFFTDDLYKGAKWDRLNKFTRRVQLNECQGLFFPFNVARKHWVLFVAHTQTLEIWALDSGSRFHAVDLLQVGEKVAKYLMDWAKRENVATLKNDWTIILKKTPQQQNKHDCGLFAMQYARNIALEGAQIAEVEQDNMQHLRRKMIMELFYGRLFPL